MERSPCKNLAQELCVLLISQIQYSTSNSNAQEESDLRPKVQGSILSNVKASNIKDYVSFHKGTTLHMIEDMMFLAML